MLRKTWMRLVTIGIVVTFLLTCTAGLAQIQTHVKHTVRSGDTLYALARRYNVSIDELVRINDLKNPNSLSIGMELLIPAASAVHVVARGDTLYGLARRYNTDIDTLIELNNITNPNALSVGAALLVPGSEPAGAETAVVAQTTAPAIAETVKEALTEPTIHTVVRGDTLWDLGQRYGTTPQAIAANSGISITSLLSIGMKLVIPATDSNGDSGEAAQAAPVWVGAEAIAWSEVNRIFEVGMTARVTDVKTGLQYTIVRRGGTYHADSEPRTAADSAVMNRLWGGWSWERRSIVVEVAGYRIAASMHSMPHGQQRIANNNFPGHFCVHFLNSRTHGSAYTNTGVPVACPQHQACVRQAIGK